MRPGCASKSRHRHGWFQLSLIGPRHWDVPTVESAKLTAQTESGPPRRGEENPRPTLSGQTTRSEAARRRTRPLRVALPRSCRSWPPAVGHQRPFMFWSESGRPHGLSGAVSVLTIQHGQARPGTARTSRCMHHSQWKANSSPFGPTGMGTTLVSPSNAAAMSAIYRLTT